MRSPIVGPAGNVEFLMHLSTEGDDVDCGPRIEEALQA
jgi:hypothetical protein